MFFLGNGMSKFMRNDVRSPAVALFVENFVLKKEKCSRSSITFSRFWKENSYHVFPCGESEGKITFKIPIAKLSIIFSLFFCRRTFPIVQSPLKGWQNNRWQTWLTNATRTLPFIIPSTTMRSFGLRVFYSSWSAL